MNQTFTGPCMKNRGQYLNKKLGRWVKIDTATGAIMQVKRDEKPFARVRTIKLR